MRRSWGPLNGIVSAHKTLQGSMKNTWQLLGGTKESFPPRRDHWFALQAINDFLPKVNCKKNRVSGPTWYRNWELFSLRQIVVLFLELLQLVELVGGRDVLDEGLEEVLCQNLCITLEYANLKLLVRKVLHRTWKWKMPASNSDFKQYEVLQNMFYVFYTKALGFTLGLCILHCKYFFDRVA